MTPKAQRIAIAEACGWTNCGWYNGDNSSPGYWNGYPPATIEVDARGEWVAKRAKYHEPLPDYLHDLNAMHEAEKVLTGDQWTRYCKLVDTLSRTVNRIPNWQDINPSYIIDAHQIHADADIKAEAFVRTLDKWEDGK